MNALIVQRALAWVLALYVRLVLATQRWRVLGGEHLPRPGDPPVIAVFWHEALPASAMLSRLARAAGLAARIVVLASRHRDGQLIGHVMENFGMELVAGSTSKGGAAGLRALARALAAGKHVALTPDGPRGPRRVAAPGVAQLAALSGARVLPCGAATSRAITLNSWDKMRLALPFGRAVLVLGQPIIVPRENWEAGLAAITAGLNAAQNAAAP